VDLLETERIRLRGWHHDDAAAFLDIYSRIEVVKWLGAHPRRPLESLEAAIARIGAWRQLTSELRPPLGLWAIVPVADPAAKPIGTALLLPLTTDEVQTEEIEIGWHLHPDQQGKGFATEAAQALLQAAASSGSGSVALRDEQVAIGGDDNVIRFVETVRRVVPRACLSLFAQRKKDLPIVAQLHDGVRPDVGGPDVAVLVDPDSMASGE